MKNYNDTKYENSKIWFTELIDFNRINRVTGINGINGNNGINGINRFNGINRINGINVINGINGINRINSCSPFLVILYFLLPVKVFSNVKCTGCIQ